MMTSDLHTCAHVPINRPHTYTDIKIRIKGEGSKCGWYVK